MQASSMEEDKNSAFGHIDHGYKIHDDDVDALPSIVESPPIALLPSAVDTKKRGTEDHAPEQTQLSIQLMQRFVEQERELALLRAEVVAAKA